MPRPIAYLQHHVILRDDNVGDALVEAHVDAHLSRSREKVCPQLPATDGHARCAEDALIRLVGEAQPLALGVQNLDAGRINPIGLYRFKATQGAQAVGAVGRKGEEHAFIDGRNLAAGLPNRSR